MTDTYGHYRGRRDDLEQALEAISSDDPDDQDEGHAALEVMPLEIATETVYRIVLGTGGPHDEVAVSVNAHGDVVGGEYRYWWYGQPGHGTYELSADEAELWADAFAIGQT